MVFLSYLQISALAFHTASTGNTIHTGEMTLDAYDTSVPLETVMAIYNHTDKALQALNEGNTSEVENQLNFTKEILSFVISNNESNQRSPGSNTTQTIARPDGTANIDASIDATIDPSEDTAAIETDTLGDNQGLSEIEIRERSGERRQVVP